MVPPLVGTQRSRLPAHRPLARLEALRDQPGTAFGSWYREHLDHHLPILMGPDGPFRDCANGHYAPDPLPVSPHPPADSSVWEVASAAPQHTGHL